MQLYLKFRNSSLDLSPLGLHTGTEESNSVYTPSGSRIVAWVEKDGAHFCQVEGFGDYVFAVDPSAPPGDCIHPVAKTLLDFISLLITCGNAKLIYQAYQWSNTLFNLRRKEVRPSIKMRSVMRALENTYRPPVIAEPYLYIRSLQTAFDYTTLPLHPDYFEWCPIRPGKPDWNVGFGTGFGEYCEKSKVGKAYAVNKTFSWNREKWSVPAIYLTESGIVVDFYLEVPLQSIQAFLIKWGEREKEPMSIEEEMYRKLEYPLGLSVIGNLSVNDRPIPLKKGYTQVWNPMVVNTWQARRTLEHYGLDPEKGYLMHRACFLRKGKNPPIRAISLTLQAEPVSVPGERFVAPQPGEYLTFKNPATGNTHDLTVIAQTREALDPNFLSNHPCCYTRLTYSLSPDINNELFRIVDCDPGDRWESKDGPTAVFLTGKTPSSAHFAVSSLRYTPAERITWRMVFLQKLRQDITVPLLP